MAKATNNRVIWRPQPKQAQFMARPEYEALYGGAAGGGKSEALVMEALRQVNIPHYKALILRKTYPQLAELIDKSRYYYPRAFPGAKYNESSHIWRFPSGAQIVFGSLQRTADRTKYQGQAYDFVGFDELTHFTFDEYSYLFSRNRPSGPGTRVYMRATANPGGIGHGWVKDRFVTAAAPMTPIKTDVRVLTPDGPVDFVRKRIFVPATVYDNKILMANDPNYIANLGLLPDAERNALLYGDWDSFSGQVFCEWRNDPARYHDRIYTHVIAPFRVPDGWRIYMGFDWGYSRPFSCGWYAVGYDGRIYRIRELYGTNGQPNVGCKWEPAKVAAEILRIEQDDPNIKGRKVLRIADPAIFADDRGAGTSIANMMQACGVYFQPGNHARMDGKMQLHNRLAFDDNGIPMLYVFSTCSNFIRTIPALVYDQRNVEDIDTDGEDHIYDECRYVLMEHPIAPPERKERQLAVYDPLATEETVYDRYDFYRY